MIRSHDAEVRIEQAMQLSEFLTEVAATAPRPSSGEHRPLRPHELLATLTCHDVEFVVIGDFALAAHGCVRATKGVQISPAPDPLNLDRLARAVRSLEADGEEDGLRLEVRALNTRFGRLDVMQDVPGLRDYAHLRAGAIRVLDLLYAGYDELISMKAASGRDEDLRDIGALEAARRGG